MGYLTTIIIHNDAFHSFKEHPKEFAEAIIEGVYEAQREHKQVDVGFFGYANYISVEPSRHADDHTVFVHYGNTVFNINPYNEDFDKLVSRDIDNAESFVKVAQRIIDNAKERIKEERKIQKRKMKDLLNNVPRHGQKLNLNMKIDLPDCHDCGVKPGQVHKTGCDVERCSSCGGQKLMCGCEDHDPSFSRWTGIWPGHAEARELGLFSKFSPEKGWETCDAFDENGHPDLNTFHAMELNKTFFVKPKNS